MIYHMAQEIETRWDGITTVSATLGITIVTAIAVGTSQMTVEGLYLTIAALSGIGGYSMHSIVRRDKK